MRKPPVYLGIDPGASGAIAALEIGGEVVSLIKNSETPADVAAWLREQVENKRAYAFLEKVHAMPKQGVTSAFSFGRSLGVIEGLICSLQAPLAFVSPAKWKRAMRVSWEKDSARDAVTRMFPHVAPLVSRAMDHNRAEAALIAEWGRRNG